MMRWGPCALFVLCLPSAWAGTVPGTSWQLDEKAGFSSAEQAQLEQIAQGLPLVLTDVPDGPRLVRKSWPEGEDPDHKLVRSERAGAVLMISPAAFKGEAPALRRALVHGLAHSVDGALGWSDMATWQMLSGWEFTGLWAPEERDALMFADPRGMGSAGEDLATSIEHYLAPSGGPRAVCGLRSKWRFLQGQLGREPARVPCASLAQVGLDPDAIDRLELIYAQPSTRNPGSLAGHLSLGVLYKPVDGRAPRHDVYQLGAVIGNTKPLSLSYVTKGLYGGFDSVVARQPYIKVAMHYGKQNRSLTRLELRLSAAQKLRLLERLDDVRQGWDRTYLFLTRNCTLLPVTLMEWALGEDLNLPAVAGPDVFLGVLERRGLLAALPATSIYEFTQFRRTQVARDLQDVAEAEILDADPAIREPLAAAMSQLREVHEAERLEGYLALGSLAPSLLKTHPEVHPQLVRVLVWSEENERLVSARSRGKRGATSLAALWSAQAAVRAAAKDLDLPSQGSAGAHERLLKILMQGPVGGPRLSEDRELIAESSHTALSRSDLLGGVVRAKEGFAPSLIFRSTWYRYRLGEIRRYAFGEGVDLTAGGLRYRLDLTESPRHSLDLVPIRMDWIIGHSRFLNPGVHISLLRAHREMGAKNTMRVDGIELGLPLELWQHDKHRIHLGISAGLSGGALGEGGETLLEMDWQGRLTAPMRLFMRAGSPREPLTSLALSAVWAPVLMGEDPVNEAAAELESSLRLGALWGADLGLVGIYGVEPSVPESRTPWLELDHRLTFGLAIERY